MRQLSVIPLVPGQLRQVGIRMTLGMQIRPSVPPSAASPSPFLLLCSQLNSFPKTVHPQPNPTPITMLRSRLSPLHLSSQSNSILRQSFPKLSRSLYTDRHVPQPVLPKVKLTIRPAPSRHTIQLGRMFSTTAVTREVKATIVSFLMN